MLSIKKFSVLCLFICLCIFSYSQPAVTFSNPEESVLPQDDALNSLPVFGSKNCAYTTNVLANQLTISQILFGKWKAELPTYNKRCEALFIDQLSEKIVVFGVIDKRFFVAIGQDNGTLSFHKSNTSIDFSSKLKAIYNRDKHEYLLFYETCSNNLNRIIVSIQYTEENNLINNNQNNNICPICDDNSNSKSHHLKYLGISHAADQFYCNQYYCILRKTNNKWTKKSRNIIDNYKKNTLEKRKDLKNKWIQYFEKIRGCKPPLCSSKKCHSNLHVTSKGHPNDIPKFHCLNCNRYFLDKKNIGKFRRVKSWSAFSNQKKEVKKNKKRKKTSASKLINAERKKQTRSNQSLGPKSGSGQKDPHFLDRIDLNTSVDFNFLFEPNNNTTLSNNRNQLIDYNATVLIPNVIPTLPVSCAFGHNPTNDSGALSFIKPIEYTNYTFKVTNEYLNYVKCNSMFSFHDFNLERKISGHHSIVDAKCVDTTNHTVFGIADSGLFILLKRENQLIFKKIDSKQLNIDYLDEIIDITVQKLKNNESQYKIIYTVKHNQLNKAPECDLFENEQFDDQFSNFENEFNNMNAHQQKYKKYSITLNIQN